MEHQHKPQLPPAPNIGKSSKIAGVVGCVSIAATLAIMQVPWQADLESPRNSERTVVSNVGAAPLRFDYLPAQFPAPAASPEEHVQAF